MAGILVRPRILSIVAAIARDSRARRHLARQESESSCRPGERTRPSSIIEMAGRDDPMRNRISMASRRARKRERYRAQQAPAERGDRPETSPAPLFPGGALGGGSAHPGLWEPPPDPPGHQGRLAHPAQKREALIHHLAAICEHAGHVNKPRYWILKLRSTDVQS